MATEAKVQKHDAKGAETDSSLVTRLADKGEEAVARLREEVSKSPRLSGTVETAKGKLDSASRSARAQLGLATSAEVTEVREKLADLERRLKKLEAGETRRSTSKTGQKKGKTPERSSAAKGASRSKA